MSESSPLRILCRQCYNPIDISREGLETGLNCPVCDLLLEPSSIAELLASATPAESHFPDPIRESNSDLVDGNEPAAATSPAKDDGPLRIEGLEDTEETFAIKCRICDSHILTKDSQVGKTIQCPTCFSSIEVQLPPFSGKKKNRPPLRPNYLEMRYESETSTGSRTTGTNESAEPPEDELKLENLPEEENNTREKDRSVPPVSLSPAGSGDPESNLEQPPRPLSRRELYELAQKRERERRQPKSFFGKSNSPKSTASKSTSPKSGASGRSGLGKTSDAANFHAGDSTDDPSKPGDSSEHPNSPLNLDQTKGVSDQSLTIPLAGRLLTGLFSDGWLYLPLSLVITLLCCGNWLALVFSPAPEAEILEWLKMMTMRALLGGIPYLLGTLGLWYLAGVVFREAAEGNLRVRSWSLGNPEQFASTLGLFGFSFFVAGLPIAPFAWFGTTPFMLLHPLRFLLSPLFLVAAWYNQHPLGIIAIDSMTHLKSHWIGWSQLYVMILGLSFISFVGSGLLLLGPVRVFFWLVPFLSLMGAILLSLATLSFAAISGWHAGYIARGNPK
jgi:hypothetical protein